MGGHSIPAGGHAVTFDPARCEPDAARRTCRVHGGTRWRRAIAALDRVGLSPAVMQSNADFSVGGTLSVNAHGWPAPFGPFGETVRSFRLMLADGTILDCSPAAHPDLFRAAIGGYGLLGVVLDAELDVVENALLAPTGEILPASAFAARLLRHVDGDPLLRMAYGRLSPARSAFLEEALLVTWRPAPTPAGGLPPAGSGGLVAGVSREVFRAQAGSEFWKGVRWDLERRLGGGGGAATRNTLMNEPVSGLAGRDRGRTDILHEYFVPPDRFAEFLAACREVIPPSGQDLLNVTLRHVEADRRSLLAYAPGGRRVAAVMLFAQPATAEADAAMRRMTEALVERVLAIGDT